MLVTLGLAVTSGIPFCHPIFCTLVSLPFLLALCLHPAVLDPAYEFHQPFLFPELPSTSLLQALISTVGFRVYRS